MSTEERLEKLERELNAAKRRLRWLLAGWFVAVGAFAMVWTFTETGSPAQAQGTKEIRANKFILEDGDGKTSAMLSVNEDGPELLLYGKSGEPHVLSLCVTKDGPSLALHGNQAQPHVQLFVDKDELGLSLYGEPGESGAHLLVSKDGPCLLLRDEHDKYAALSVTGEGPALELRDAQGKSRAVLLMIEDRPRMFLFDDKGNLIWTTPR